MSMTKPKTILFLGAAPFQTPAIKCAKALGHRVITCDNRPGNPGHRIADAWYEISTTDRSGVLELAKKESVDAVLTFGSDVSAPTAAYVCEELGFPTSPLSSFELLTNKSKFRAFLSTEGLQELAFVDCAEVDISSLTAKVVERLQFPVILKPVDSAGSKGVTVLASHETLKEAAIKALEYSIAKKVIVEEYRERSGYQICGDGFMYRGALVFVEFGDGHFHEDSQLAAPFGETFPSSHSKESLERVRVKVEDVLQKAGYHVGPFNLDVFIQPDGEPFIIELAPRSGGNFIPDAMKLKSGFDLYQASIALALGDQVKIPSSPQEERFIGCYMIHSKRGGTYRGVSFSEGLKRNLVLWTPYISAGTPLQRFYTGRDVVGNLLIQFDSFDEMHEVYRSIEQQITIEFD